jgi:hypothetical protein
MSLARQIVTLLDLAAGPLSVPTLVAQIAALGGDAGADAVHKRMHQMKGAGQAKREGDGWVLVDGLPLQNLRAKWARDDEPAPVITAPLPVAHKPPTLRERIVQALRGNPGMTAKELGDHLGDLSDNEPASTLNILTKQQRVRHEGEWPARRYFACDDSERLVLPRAGKRKKSGAESREAKAAEQVADAAVDEGAKWFQLVDDVEYWLKSYGTWCTPAFLVTTMESDKGSLADALEYLVSTGRAVSRFVSALERAKQYAHISSPVAGEKAEPSKDNTEPAATPADPAEAADPMLGGKGGPAAALSRGESTRCEAAAVQKRLPCAEPGSQAPQLFETGPLTDTHGPIAGEGLRELAARDAAAFLTQAATAYTDLARDMDQLDKAIGANPATLPGYARCIALDLEDAIGRACDQRADHAAIKALSVALGSTWRAITQLSPGA